MKKVILLVLISFTFSSCSIKYYGYLYDFNTKTPVEEVEIFSTLVKDTSLSEKNGYFEFKTKEKVKQIIFNKEGYQPFHLRTLSIQSGEFVKELPFGDTIYLISKNSKYSRPTRQLPHNNSLE